MNRTARAVRSARLKRWTLPQSVDGSLFLHYPCFDGLVSAAITWDFLETQARWSIDHLEFVNYDRSPTWLDVSLPAATAVVDFLYHPDAEFWADHHGTTFVNAASRRDFECRKDNRFLLYDRLSSSCAMLLWKHLEDRSSDRGRYDEMARWADRIDAARYDSVDDAIFGRSSAAMEINVSLSSNADQKYGEMLLRAMRSQDLDQIAALSEVQGRVDGIRARIERGLTLVRDSIQLDGGNIAVLDVEPPDDVTVNRYSPYVYFPNARYSVALTRSGSDAKLTAMRNPWRDFESIDLGAIVRNYGGGGHQRVGSVVIRSEDPRRPSDVLHHIVEAIRRCDREGAAMPQRVPA